MKNRKMYSELEYMITGAAIEVHKLIGPGLLESAYHQCMKVELQNRGLNFKSELTVPFEYKGTDISTCLLYTSPSPRD